MRLGVLLGDASYAIYLVHPFPMRAFREVWARLDWTGMAGILSYVSFTVLFFVRNCRGCAPLCGNAAHAGGAAAASGVTFSPEKAPKRVKKRRPSNDI